MNFKKVLSLIIVGVVCLTLFSGCGEDTQNSPSTTTQISNQNAEKTIVLVGESENIGFWQNVKKGAEEAAKKYGYKLNYMGTDEVDENVVSAHISSIDKSIKEGVAGIVIAPNGEGYSDVYGKLFDEKIPVVQIDNLTEEDLEKLESNKKNPIVSTVSTSYKQSGAICAEKVFGKIKEDIKKSQNTYVIGVIERNDNETDEEKTVGFIEKFTELADADESTKGKYKIETESESKYEDSLTELIDEKAKAVFITDSSIADKISDVVSANGEKYNYIVFCGFDSGAKQLKWLGEKNGPQFIGGVTRDSYNLGYNAVEQCIFSVQGKQVKEEIEIQGHWYDKNNLDKMKQDSLVFEK